MKNKVLSDKSPTANPHAARIAAANGVTYKQYTRNTHHLPMPMPMPCHTQIGTYTLYVHRGAGMASALWYELNMQLNEWRG